MIWECVDGCGGGPLHHRFCVLKDPHGPWANAAGLGPICQTCGTDDEDEPECVPLHKPRLTTDPAARKALPITSGVLDYFPDALLAVAAVSKAGNDQHNAGQPLHWARGKSMDQSDTLVRHLLERGTKDTDGLRHSAKMAWRALALLQLEIEEEEGLPPSRGSK